MQKREISYIIPYIIVCIVRDVFIARTQCKCRHNWICMYSQNERTHYVSLSDSNVLRFFSWVCVCVPFVCVLLLISCIQKTLFFSFLSTRQSAVRRYTYPYIHIVYSAWISGLIHHTPYIQLCCYAMHACSAHSIHSFFLLLNAKPVSQLNMRKLNLFRYSIHSNPIQSIRIRDTQHSNKQASTPKEKKEFNNRRSKNEELVE